MRSFLLAAALAAVAPAHAGSLLERVVHEAQRPQRQATAFAGRAWPEPGRIDDAVRLRWGHTDAGAQGMPTCDGELLAAAKTDYRIDAPTRAKCLRDERENVLATGTNDGLARSPTPEAIERRYGAAFDARLALFRQTRRFALRPLLDTAPYDARRGALDVYMKLPLLNGFDVGGYAGENVVPAMATRGGSIGAPAHAGTFKAAFGVPTAQAAALTAQPPNATQHLLVFDVLRGHHRAGTVLPQLEIRVVQARVGFGDQVLGFDRRAGTPPATK